MELTPGEEAVKTVEMATKYGEYNINPADKTAASLRALTSILKEVLWVKCY